MRSITKSVDALGSFLVENNVRLSKKKKKIS